MPWQCVSLLQRIKMRGVMHKGCNSIHPCDHLIQCDVKWLQLTWLQADLSEWKEKLKIKNNQSNREKKTKKTKKKTKTLLTWKVERRGPEGEMKWSEVWMQRGTYTSFIPSVPFVSPGRRMHSLEIFGKEVWARDGDHSHSGNTGHMLFVISCATYVGFSIAPSLTCNCAAAAAAPPLHYISASLTAGKTLIHLLLQNSRYRKYWDRYIYIIKEARKLSLNVCRLHTWLKGAVPKFFFFFSLSHFCCRIKTSWFSPCFSF